MSGDRVVPEKTRLDQRRASDPRASAWVSANAGSGKTTVLANRVIRLLLAGTPPGRVLAITFTKAAAANMAGRVFTTLSAWVSLDDRALAARLEELEGEPSSPETIAIARRLFARAIETPGGLKIQTIHAFSERLLHLFPFEANVAARFEVLDEATGAELLAAARRQVLVRAMTGADAPLADALSVLNETVGEDAFATLVGKAVKVRSTLGPRAAGHAALDALMAQLAFALGVSPGVRSADLEDEILGGGIPAARWPDLMAALAAGGRRVQDWGEALRRASTAQNPEERRAAYAEIFLTAKGEPRADTHFLDKGFQARHAAWADALSTEKARLGALMDRIRAAATVERTRALLTLADAVGRRYDECKSRRGALDFDDLIARTSDLLSRRCEAAWVLYKLDQGIDHILVDEAQDTSAPQWAILRALADDFVSGHARPGRVRTLFAVGDPKQSIYSFQGAAPEAFEAARRDFGRRIAGLAAGGDPQRWRFEDVTLTLSFRSAHDVLDAVDTVFAPPAHHRSLSFGDPVAPRHQSARPSAPGLVELWDTEQHQPAPEPDAWDKPLDQAAESAPAVRLAERIAATLARWMHEGDETGRRIPPGDVLVLVRNRNVVFEAVIRALKTAGVPVAGADRLTLTQHIAVLDLIALGRASLLPDDDLTLAAALKSPLLGLDDDDLERVAAGRPGSLAEALARAAREDARLADVQDRLARWRRLAVARGPFGFYATLLGPEGGRRAVLGRLGSEAGDAVDEFLRLALDHEQREVASLSLFLAAFADTDLVIKRDMEAAGGEVRVMTVHGAKGLEAPVVILADTCTAPNSRHDEPILLLESAAGPLPVWSRAKAQDPQAVAQARTQGQTRALQEYHRLLYVALTRACDRLVIAGFEGAKGRARGCWYDLVADALRPRMSEETSGGRTVWRLRSTLPLPPVERDAQPERPDPAMPAWLLRPAAAEPEPRPPLRPSSALSAADGTVPPAAPAPVPGAGDLHDHARARVLGRCLHTLLEILPGQPAGRRRPVADALLAARVPSLAPAERDAAASAVLAVLDSPDLAPLFGPGSRAEAAVAGSLPLGPNGAEIPVSGQIDRLAVTAEEVLVADFKTAASPAASAREVPDEHVAQLALYAALAARLFPGRRVRALLVWTMGPSVHEIDPARLAAALARIKPA